MMEAQYTSEALDNCSILTQLVAWEDFTAHSCHDSLKSYIKYFTLQENIICLYCEYYKFLNKEG
jgi:hypothetical protein